MLDGNWLKLSLLLIHNLPVKFARDMLIHRRQTHALLEGAVCTGVLTPEVAGPCIVELLRAGRTGSSDFLVAGDA